MSTDPDRAATLAAEANARGDYHWFERLYAEADRGEAEVPWDHARPSTELVRRLSEPGIGRALVVGCGLGDDAGYLRSLGYEVTAFDLSPTAVETARPRFPGITFTAADVLHAPEEWTGAFDLVYEAYTIQVLRDDNRDQAIRAISEFVAPGGKLLVIGFMARPDDAPPRIAQPLTRAELDAFVHNGLTQGLIEERPPSEDAPGRWQYVAEFTR